jgi:hypothetical protein
MVSSGRAGRHRDRHECGTTCDGGDPITTATDRMGGSISPDQAGFRFMVSDMAKQLFPDGFGTIPGALSGQEPWCARSSSLRYRVRLCFPQDLSGV